MVRYGIISLLFSISSFCIALTPTKAYLSIPELAALAKESWSGQKDTYKDIFKAIEKKEVEYDETHYVFYHGQSDRFRLFQDTLNALYSCMKKKPVKDFYFLRSWYNFPKKIDANAYIDNYEQKNGSYWSDQGGPLVNDLLSVNLSLFGNTTQWGECTLKLFCNNSSYFFNGIDFLLYDIFKHMGLDTQYVDQLIGLGSKFSTPEGMILQIFIPKNLVDRCAYLCHRWAPPFNSCIVPACFDLKKCRHTSISPILDLYKNNPDGIQKLTLSHPNKTSPLATQNLDLLQARLIFSQDILLNPESGVKIFRYTAVSDTQMKAYQNKVNDIVREAWNKKSF